MNSQQHTQDEHTPSLTHPGSGEILSGAFEQELLAAGCEVVERAQVDRVLREKKLSADTKSAKKIGETLGVDALLFGRITDFREPRMVTQYGRLGVTARLVFVPTQDVLWTGSDASSVYTFEDSARSVADSIVKAVKKTWPSQLKK